MREIDPDRFRPFVPPTAVRDAVVLGAGLLKLNARNAAQLEAELERGLVVGALPALADAAGLSLKALAPLVGVSYSSLNRLKTTRRRLTPQQSARAYRLARLFESAFEVIGDEAEARAWLGEPALALGDRTPLETVRTALGAEWVAGLLERLDDGVYS